MTQALKEPCSLLHPYVRHSEGQLRATHRTFLCGVFGGGRGRITSPRQNFLCTCEKYNEINWHVMFGHVMLMSTVLIYRGIEKSKNSPLGCLMQ